jgi:hypothetical protein
MTPESTPKSETLIDARVRGVLTVVCAAAVIVGLTVGAMVVLSTPGGWVMQAANQAILDQQAIATSYIIK